MSRLHLALLGFLAIIGFFLITEHWAHLYGYLPFLLLLACPLLHIFGHGGHGGHGGNSDGETSEKKSSSSPSHSTMSVSLFTPYPPLQWAHGFSRVSTVVFAACMLYGFSLRRHACVLPEPL